MSRHRRQVIGSNWIIEIFPMDNERIGFYRGVLGGNWKIKPPNNMVWIDGGVLPPVAYARFMDFIEAKPWKIDI